MLRATAARRVFLKKIPGLRKSCYLAQARKRRGPDLNGRVKLTVVVGKSGRASKVIVGATRLRPALLRCIKAKLRRVRYGRVYGSVAFSIVVSFIDAGGKL